MKNKITPSSYKWVLWIMSLLLALAFYLMVKVSVAYQAAVIR